MPAKVNLIDVHPMDEPIPYMLLGYIYLIKQCLRERERKNNILFVLANLMKIAVSVLFLRAGITCNLNFLYINNMKYKTTTKKAN